jgi:hypothetical protein
MKTILLFFCIVASVYVNGQSIELKMEPQELFRNEAGNARLYRLPDLTTDRYGFYFRDLGRKRKVDIDHFGFQDVREILILFERVLYTIEDGKDREQIVGDELILISRPENGKATILFRKGYCQLTEMEVKSILMLFE